MFPLIPTLALSILSLLSSVFVILRILIPLIPPHPVSGRAINKHSWATTKSLSLPDRGHLWLALSDLLSLAVFLWEAFMESEDTPEGSDIARDTLSSSRLWFVVMLRQSCLFIILAYTLVRIRRAKPVTYGPKSWIIWVPVVIVSIVSTTITAVLASRGVASVFVGSICYSLAIGLLSTGSILCLFLTLRSISHNISPCNGPASLKDELHAAVQEKKRRQSFAAEDIEALKDGSSWITSDAGSRHTSISSFSFDPSVKDANTYGPVAGSSPHESPVDSHNDSSWLTEPSQSPVTVTDWSFPTTMKSSSRGCTALNSHAQHQDARLESGRLPHSGLPGQVPGEYTPAYNPTIVDLNSTEKGFPACTENIPKNIEIPISCLFGWLLFIWTSLILSLPYLIVTSPSQSVSTLFVLSTTLTAPILVVNSIFCPLPVPMGLFELPSNLPKPSGLRDKYRRSGSITVVEGRLSTDVWMLKGDAVDRKSRLSRATSLLSRVPKLSVLPQQDPDNQAQPKTHPTIPEQENSAATSAYVAIEADSIGNIERTFYTKARYSPSVSSIGESLAAAIHAAERRNVPESIPGMTGSVPLSRRTSTSSRSSRGSQIHSKRFSTNLETIRDDNSVPSREGSLISLEHSSNEQCHNVHRELSPAPPVSQGPSRNSTVDFSQEESYGETVEPTLSRPPEHPRGTYEIDSLSANLLPQLLPGLTIGSDIRVIATPERARRNTATSMAFSSPDVTSTPPFKAFGKRIAKMRKRHGSAASRTSGSVVSQGTYETDPSHAHHRLFSLTSIPDALATERAEEPNNPSNTNNPQAISGPSEEKSTRSVYQDRRASDMTTESQAKQRSMANLLTALETPTTSAALNYKPSKSNSEKRDSGAPSTFRSVSTQSADSRGQPKVNYIVDKSSSNHSQTSKGRVRWPSSSDVPVLARVRDTDIEYGTDAPSSKFPSKIGPKSEKIFAGISRSQVPSPPESITSSPSRKIKALFRRSSEAAVLSSQERILR